MKPYDRYLLPRLTDCVCGLRSLARLRALVVPRAQGTVLELGAGSCPNLPFYDQTRVERLLALEPSAGLRDMARCSSQNTAWPPPTAAWRAVDRLLHGYWGTATAPPD